MKRKLSDLKKHTRRICVILVLLMPKTSIRTIGSSSKPILLSLTFSYNTIDPIIWWDANKGDDDKLPSLFAHDQEKWNLLLGLQERKRGLLFLTVALFTMEGFMVSFGKHLHSCSIHNCIRLRFVVLTLFFFSLRPSLWFTCAYHKKEELVCQYAGGLRYQRVFSILQHFTDALIAVKLIYFFFCSSSSSSSSWFRSV